MSRTKAVHLALLNWRGVFYQKYELNEHVTALEGGNGAGKTTVLIACYLVLFPDLSRVRFSGTNDGSGTGGDRGIWGRLGELQQPSYAVMQIRIGAEYILAGVHLERRAEPVLEISPFIVTGLGKPLKLQDVLLVQGEFESIPTLPELKQQMARHGGRMEMLSAKDYFIKLFDMNVLPLRLSADDERTKFNEMLHTTMSGGISKALVAGFREFLLKAEPGLSATLRKMQSNLSACRQTRQEVENSEKLHREITGIYEAGLKMFAAAAHATQERANEAQKRLDDRVHELNFAMQQEIALRNDLSVKQTDQSRLTSEFEAASGRKMRANDRLELLQKALAVLNRMHERERTLKAADGFFSEAKQLEFQAAKARDLAQREKNTADTNVTEASIGMTDFARGLEKLLQRVSEYRRTTKLLMDSRAELPDENLDPARSTEVLSRLDFLRRTAAHNHNRVSRDLTTADERRREHALVYTALRRAAREEVAHDIAYARAQRLLGEFRDFDDMVRRRGATQTELSVAVASAKQQLAMRTLATNLQLPKFPIRNSSDVKVALEAVCLEIAAEQERFAKATAEASNAKMLAENTRSLIQKLQQDQRAWNEVDGKLRALESMVEKPLRTREAIFVAKGEWDTNRDRLRGWEKEFVLQLDNLRRQLTELERASGGFPAELLNVREAIDGEFFAMQYEDVSLKDAGRIEAALGPLRHAIQVEDPIAAAQTISRMQKAPDTVWLLGGDATLDQNPAETTLESFEKSVLVTGTTGWRVTRIPDAPLLGRRAREAQIKQLREDANNVDGQLQITREQLAQSVRVLKAVDIAIAGIFVIENGDPASKIETAEAELSNLTKCFDEFSTEAVDAKAREKAIEPRQRDLTTLAPYGYLLDGPDFSMQAAELQKLLNRIKASAVELDRVAADRDVLAEGLDILRHPPLSESNILELQSQQTALKQMHERLEGVFSNFTYIHENRAALEWYDAETELLRSKKEVEPVLAQQLREATEAQARAQDQLIANTTNWSSAVAASARAQSSLDTAKELYRVKHEQWAKYGLDNVSDTDVAEAEVELATATVNVATVEALKNGIVSAIAVLLSKIEGACEVRKSCEHEKVEAAKLAGAARESWESFQRLATDNHVLNSVLTQTFVNAFAGQGSPNLNIEAQNNLAILVERLKPAKENAAILEESAKLSAAPNRSGPEYLSVWLKVRNWLLQRVPVQLAQVDDPLESLEQLKRQLVELNERLKNQERELRGESADVAHSIQSHIRRAQSNIKRITRDLENVRFGSIHGVRIVVERIDQMDQILRALQNGSVQTLLFEEDMPIEEALTKLFERQGGKTTGQRLLDYREYINPRVEIKRQGSDVWTADAHRVSTGEGIGIGAAIMIVVLTVWERDANLMRPKQTQSTLRLLFLDEATRLSQENLLILFDLCQNLDLQLLIAAPDVAIAKGNTTYSLSRRLDENGREEVIASGRRIIAEGATNDVASH